MIRRPSDLSVPISRESVTIWGLFPSDSGSSPPISRSSGRLRELRTELRIVWSKFQPIWSDLQSLRAEVWIVSNRRLESKRRTISAGI